MVDGTIRKERDEARADPLSVINSLSVLRQLMNGRDRDSSCMYTHTYTISVSFNSSDRVFRESEELITRRIKEASTLYYLRTVSHRLFFPTERGLSRVTYRVTKKIKYAPLRNHIVENAVLFFRDNFFFLFFLFFFIAFNSILSSICREETVMYKNLEFFSRKKNLSIFQIIIYFDSISN